MCIVNVAVVKTLASPIFFMTILTPGAAIIIIDVHKKIIKKVGPVAITIAHSNISRGKSNCTKVATATCGNYPKGYVIHLSKSHARSCLASGLLFVYDDPSSDTVLKQLQ